MPAFSYVEAYDTFFNLNDTYMADLRERAYNCGYTSFMEEWLTFPPKGPLPNIPLKSSDIPAECLLWDDIFAAVSLTNPCFDVYSISTTCPVLWDVLGFPGSFDYLPDGAEIYFNRTDVQRAINAPIQEWAECSNIALDQDTSLPSSLSVLPSVIDRSKRTIIAHGQLDYVLLHNGTLLSIQNMTWGGQQGFQSAPKDDFYVPYHNELSASTLAASGIMGKTHTERNLTYVEVLLSGHMVPQYQPSVAYRQMEYLLGRIPSLTEISSFTTQPNVPQPGGGNSSAPQGYVKPSGGAKMTQEELFGLLTGK
jgi:carboxypeptidase D